jgi:predicted Mrr-cat superfamily restriction endonuclease
MARWMIRSGRDDVFLASAIANQVALIGFRPLDDIADIAADDAGRAELFRRVTNAHPARAPTVITKWSNEIWAFRHEIMPGDQIFMPHSRGTRAWKGHWGNNNYAFRTDLEPQGLHSQPVQWEADLDREEVDDAMASYWMRRATVVRLR